MDAFEILGLPRALVLDDSLLEQRFRELGKEAHPDVGGTAGEFEKLRKAYEVLKSPLGRIREAQPDSDTRGEVPMAVMDLFSPMAEVLQTVDEFLGAREKARSALVRALLDAKVPELKVRLENLGDELTAMEQSLTERFSSFDKEGWEASSGAMGEAARGLAFLEKWQAQLRSATGKLFQAMLG